MRTILGQLWSFETCLLVDISKMIEIALFEQDFFSAVYSKENYSGPIVVFLLLKISQMIKIALSEQHFLFATILDQLRLNCIMKLLKMIKMALFLVFSIFLA